MTTTAMRLMPLVLLVALAACSGTGDGVSDAGPLRDEDVLAATADFRTSAAFVQISDATTPSAHGAADRVHVYVSVDAADNYREVDPGMSDQTIDAFAPGTVIVKDHLDTADEPNGSYTVMYKAAAGYDAEHGDWWWGRIVGDAVADGGQVGYCIACHEESGFNDTDWVGGVPLDNRR